MGHNILGRGRWLDVLGQVQHKRRRQVASCRVSTHDHITGIHWDMMGYRAFPILHYQGLMVGFSQIQKRRKRVCWIAKAISQYFFLTIN